MTDQVNEGNAAWLTATLRDKAGNLATPSSATYRIDCLTTGEEVRDTTALSAASEMEIALTIADTAIVNEGNSIELKRVTVIGVYGDGDEVKAQYDFNVKNLSGV